MVTTRLLTTSFTVAETSSAATDFANTANFSFPAGPAHLNPPFSSNVAFQEASFGAVPWAGLAVRFTVTDQPCATFPGGALTGNCTMTNKADYALIRFNSYYSYTSAQRANLLRHEFAHILGLAHSTCATTDSVMAPALSCSPLRTTLQPIDKSIIQSWYP